VDLLIIFREGVQGVLKNGFAPRYKEMGHFHILLMKGGGGEREVLHEAKKKVLREQGDGPALHIGRHGGSKKRSVKGGT